MGRLYQGRALADQDAEAMKAADELAARRQLLDRPPLELPHRASMAPLVVVICVAVGAVLAVIGFALHR